MQLSRTEPKSFEDLQTLIEKEIGADAEFNVAVEALIFDRDSQWIMMHRGAKARDEVDKLEGIGGRYENDTSFRAALFREMEEEIGADAEIEIVGFNEVKHDIVRLDNLGKEVNKNWIVLSYLCAHRSGQLKIMEPEKCVGFEYIKDLTVDPSRLTSSAQKSLSFLKSNWSQVDGKIKEFFKGA